MYQQIRADTELEERPLTRTLLSDDRRVGANFHDCVARDGSCTSSVGGYNPVRRCKLTADDDNLLSTAGNSGGERREAGDRRTRSAASSRGAAVQGS